MNTDGEEENEIMEHTRASPSPDNVRKKKRKRVETTGYQESQVQDTSQGQDKVTNELVDNIEKLHEIVRGLYRPSGELTRAAERLSFQRKHI